MAKAVTSKDLKINKAVQTSANNKSSISLLAYQTISILLVQY